jgi:hypothetical protein
MSPSMQAHLDALKASLYERRATTDFDVSIRVQVSERTLRIIFLHPPAPMNNHGIRTGAMNPPLITSDDNSDNEATCGCRPGILAPQEAVRLVQLRGEGLLDKTGSQKRHTASGCAWQTVPNAEPILRARKISHFWSNAEIAIPCQRHKFPDSISRAADVSDGIEHFIPKPLLVHNEVRGLLQPAMKLLSATHYNNRLVVPTNMKSVHFDELRNETRYFLQVDKPMAMERPTKPTPELCLSAESLRDASRNRYPSPISSHLHSVSGSTRNKTSARFGVDLISFLLVFAITLSASYLFFGGPRLYP